MNTDDDGYLGKYGGTMPVVIPTDLRCYLCGLDMDPSVETFAFADAIERIQHVHCPEDVAAKLP